MIQSNDSVVVRYLRIVGMHIRESASQVLKLSDERRLLLNALIVIKAHPPLLDAFSANSSIRDGVLRASLLDLRLNDSLCEIILDIHGRFRSLSEVETVIAFSSAKERGFISDHISKFEDGYLLRSLTSLLQRNISSESRKKIISFIERLRNIRVLSQSLVQQLSTTVANIRDDAKNLRESFEAEDELYNQIQVELEGGVRSKILDIHGSRLSGLKALAAGLFIAVNVLISACNPAMSQPGQQVQQQEMQEQQGSKLHDEKVMTVMNYTFEEVDKYLKMPCGGIEVDNDGRICYMLVGYSNSPELLFLGRSDESSSFSGNPTIIPSQQEGKWLKFVRGNSVYVFSTNSSGLGKVYMLKNGSLIPVQIAGGQVIDVYKASIHSTIDGDMFILSGVQGVQLWLVDENSKATNIQTLMGAVSVNSGNIILSITPSPDMHKFAIVTMREEENEGYVYSILLKEKNNDSWNVHKIGVPRDSVIDNETVSFDDSGRYISYHVSDDSDRRVYVNIYDVVSKKVIFSHEVRRNNMNVDAAPICWLPGSTTLLFTRILPARNKAVHKVTITNGVALLESEIFGNIREDSDVKETTKTIGFVDQIIVDRKRGQNHVYFIDARLKVIDSIRLGGE